MEQLAIRYFTLPPWAETLLLFLTLAVAGIAAAATTDFTYQMKRAQFFFIEGFLFLILSLTSVTAYMVPAAVSNGYLSALIASYYIIFAAVGFIGGVTAIARSLDGYGDRRHWFYSLIPVVNLALMLKPSLQPMKRPSIWGSVRIIALVLLGFTTYLAGKLVTRAVEGDAELIAQAASENITATRNILNSSIEYDGIEKTLKASVAGVKLPIKVDQSTTLTVMEANGSTLHYGYVVKGQIGTITEQSKIQISNNFCTGEALKPFLAGGATILATYVDENNSSVGEIRANSDICSRLKK